jgi:hypothetical protein
MDNTQQRNVLLVCLLLLLLSLNARAAGTAMFEAEVVVQDQSPAVRTAALRDALGQVLVRVTGQSGVTATEAGQALLANPEQLVQQYRYFTESGQEPLVLKLWVRFDGDAIRESLQQHGIAYWGGERPATLVWLAVEDRGNRYVVSSDDASDARRDLDAAAQARDVPLVYPLMDLEDQTRVRFSTLWNDTFVAGAASQRYHTPAVLIGRIEHLDTGGWAARWQLAMAGNTRNWSDSHPQLAALIRQGIDDLASLQASLLMAGGTAGTNAVTISVDGISSLADYARSGNYLDTLSGVRTVMVAEVTPTRVQYQLYLNGNLQELTRTIAIGSVLEPTGNGMDGSFRLRQ